MEHIKGFTENASMVLDIALRSAIRLGHSCIGTEHILYGLTSVEKSASKEILASFGITQQLALEFLAQTFDQDKESHLTMSDLTPRTKNVLRIALRISQDNGYAEVGTKHILEAIINEGGGYALDFIIQKSVDVVELNFMLKSYGMQIGNEITSDGIEQDNSDDIKKKSGFGKNSALQRYGTDMTQMAIENMLDPVIGREKEIDRLIQVLARRTKNNPCIIGEPGVGKTAIVEGLSQKIIAGDVPSVLCNKKIISLDLNSIVAGTSYRGDFEKRLKSLIDEVMQRDDIILFIDEVHTIIKAGASESNSGAGNILKPQLARGELQLIGATTTNEYRQHIEKDSALERRFQPIMVEQPTKEDAIEIIKGLRPRYEAHHKVTITDEAIVASVEMSSRYIGDRFLPDKAIDLVDEASSKENMRQQTLPDDVKMLEDELKEVQAKKLNAVKLQDFEKAAELRDKENQLKYKIEQQKVEWNNKKDSTERHIGAEDIASIVSQITNIPVSQLKQTESEKLLKLEDVMHLKVKGQLQAVKAVCDAIRRGRVGLSDPNKPVGSFIFLGPTGVGKTQVCKTLAEELFGTMDSLVRFDMSEYMEAHSVAKLIGSPPGYVGHSSGGKLTEIVRTKQYSVLLFDEIEKAHPDIFNILLQILDDGILTDSKGRNVNFKNCIVIMTSNIGSSEIAKMKSVGFGTVEQKNDYENQKKNTLEQLKKSFSPELLNRLDEIIVFHSLDKEQIYDITVNLLEQLKQRVEYIGIELSWDESAVEEIVALGYDKLYGARPIKRTITHNVENLLTNEYLKNNIKAGEQVTVCFEDGEFKLKGE